MGSSNLQHGSRTLIYINGNLYGLATAFSWSRTFERKEIRGIDVPIPLELGAGPVSISGSISVLKVVGDGGAEGANMLPQVLDIASEKYITLLLLDTLFQKVIFKADQVQVTGDSWSVAVKGMMEGQISFKAIINSNETSR